MSKIFKAENVVMDNKNKFIMQDYNDENFVTDNASEKIGGGILSNLNEMASFGKEDNSSKVAVDKSLKPRDKIVGEKVLQSGRGLKLEENKIVDNAKLRAKEMLKEAENEVLVMKKEIFEKAKEEGFKSGLLSGEEKGFKAGVLKGEEQGEKLRISAEQLKQEAEKYYSEMEEEKKKIIELAQKEAEVETVKLIQAVLAKLIEREKLVNPSLILMLIKQGLSEASSSGEVIIHLAKEDYDFVLENKGEILKELKSGVNVEFLKDATLNKSDCIIESPLGNIDSSIDMQLSGIIGDMYLLAGGK